MCLRPDRVKRGPGRNNFDMSFIKNMPLREHYNVQFRAEFYNIFNHPALEASAGTFDVSNPQFGQIVSSGNERNVQFGLRMVFETSRGKRTLAQICAKVGSN